MKIIPATEADLPALAELARVIWRACYPSIISQAQIEYMLDKMYSLEVLKAEIHAQGIHFFRLLADDQFAGFASIGPTGATGVLKLHKLYLLPDFQGRGLGSLLLKHCEAEALRFGARRLILAVNKDNSRAIAAYKRNGFKVVESIVTNIGGGFVMDDFIMAKELNGTSQDSAA